MYRHCCLGKIHRHVEQKVHVSGHLLNVRVSKSKKQNTYVFMYFHGEIYLYVGAVALHRAVKGENLEGLWSSK